MERQERVTPWPRRDRDERISLPRPVTEPDRAPHPDRDRSNPADPSRQERHRQESSQVRFRGVPLRDQFLIHSASSA